MGARKANPKNEDDIFLGQAHWSMENGQFHQVEWCDL